MILGKGFAGLIKPKAPDMEYGIACCKAMMEMLKGNIHKSDMIAYAKNHK